MRSWSWSFGAASIVAICVASSVAGGSTVACSSFTSDDSEVTPDAGNGADACDDGGCVSLDGCAEKILYVSAEGGNDANTGCNPRLPKKTLGSAVSTLVILKRTDFAIHACKGEYRENGLVLTFPVALRGGYECSTGQRLPEYGFPKFNTLNETVLSVSDGGFAPAALTIGAFPPGVTGVVVIDGFRVRAPSRPNVTTSAVSLIAGAAATLSNNAIEGAGSEGATTFGIELIDTGAVHIQKNLVFGGVGKAQDGDAVGSVGILALNSGPLTIDESSIHGGAGSSRANAGSIGLAIIASEKSAKVTRSVVYGGEGTGAASASKGVATFGATVELQGNIVHGGDAKCSSATSCRTIGVELDAGSGRIAGNFIMGGNLPADATSKLAFLGVLLTNSKGADLTNNFILGGNASGITPTGASTAAGVRVVGGSGAIIRHNTILTGKSALSLGTSAVTLTGKHTGAVLENNLFVGLGAANETGVLSDCASISTLDDNGFFYLNTLALGSGGPNPTACPDYTSRTRLSDLALFVSAAVNNRRLAGNCVGETGCFSPVGCETSSALCRAAMFENFDESKLGSTSFTGERPGLRLSGKACGFANGGKMLPAVQTDFFGAMRTTPPSFGAHEQDTCQ